MKNWRQFAFYNNKLEWVERVFLSKTMRNRKQVSEVVKIPHTEKRQENERRCVIKSSKYYYYK